MVDEGVDPGSGFGFFEGDSSFALVAMVGEGFCWLGLNDSVRRTWIISSPVHREGRVRTGAAVEGLSGDEAGVASAGDGRKEGLLPLDDGARGASIGEVVSGSIDIGSSFTSS